MTINEPQPPQNNMGEPCKIHGQTELMYSFRSRGSGYPQEGVSDWEGAQGGLLGW